MTAGVVAPCPRCGKQSSEDYDGSGTCWECFGSAVQPPMSTTWRAVDLRPIVEGVRDGRLVGPVPTLLQRSDGVFLMYRGEVHSLAGEPESGKGFMMAATSADVLDTGEHVLYMDFEDGPVSIVSRLLAHGVEPDTIIERFAYVRPADPFNAEAFYGLITGQQFALAVIDGVSEAYALLGLDPYSNPDAAKFLTQLPRPLAARGAAVVEIDHVIKAKEGRGRYAIGAQHKLAGVAVAYSTDVVTVPSRTSDGLIKLKVEKDRHGHVRGHARSGVIALVHIRPEDGGDRVTVTFDPPDGGETGDEFRPTALMEKTSRFLEAEPGANTRAVRVGVQGNTKWAGEALRILIREGFVRREPHGTSQLHYSVRPYRQDHDRDPVTKACSERDQNTSVGDRDPVTPPIGHGSRNTHPEHTHNQCDRDHDLQTRAQRLSDEYGEEFQ